VELELLTRRELEVINRRSHRYPLQIAEKDYLLSIVSRIISGSSLRDRLVFKGGTALHHCCLPNLRFSEDLDFTYTTTHTGKVESSAEAQPKEEVLDEIERMLNEYDFLEVKKSYISDFTIKIEKLSFVGLLGQPNSLKIEVDMEQAVVLQPREIAYANIWRVDADMLVMDIREICAEKIRAINERARYRDFYDLNMIMKRLKPDLAVVADLISKKEARKPYSRGSIEANWEIARGEKGADGHRIFYLEEVEDSDIKGMLLDTLNELRL
jgi:predicted nucleotidyltransferase component of viral defense system